VVRTILRPKTLSGRVLLPGEGVLREGRGSRGAMDAPRRVEPPPPPLVLLLLLRGEGRELLQLAQPLAIRVRLPPRLSCERRTQGWGVSERRLAGDWDGGAGS
jgi:hypothetical protein